jgi:hypothetical protein
MNILDYQRVAACGRVIGQLDGEIAAAHAAGYSVDADRLLDERWAWQAQRDALLDAARARQTR